MSIGALNESSLTAIARSSWIHWTTSTTSTSYWDCSQTQQTFSGWEARFLLKDVGLIGAAGAPPIVPVIYH
jgi:hypothetical protein